MEREIGGEYRRELQYWERVSVMIWKTGTMRLRMWLSTSFNILIAWFFTFGLVYLYATAMDKSLKKPDTIIPLTSEVGLFDVKPFTIMFTPNNETVQDIMKDVVKYFPSDVITSTIGMGSEKDIVKECEDNYSNVSGNAVMALIFRQLPIGSNLLSYKIRDTRWNLYNTEEYFPDDKNYIPPYPELKDNGYDKTGAAALQLAIDRTIIKTFSRKSLLKDEFKINVGPFPQPQYLYGIKNGSHYVFAVVSFILAWSSFTLLYVIIQEKQNGVKELMKLVGIEKSHIWFGYWLFGFMSDIFVTLFFAMAISYDFIPDTAGLLQQSSFAVIWIFLISFSITLSFFTMLISTFFHNRFYAIITAAFIWFLPVLIYVVLPTRFAKVITFFVSLTPYGPLMNGILTIGRLENEGHGAMFSRLFNSSSRGGLAVGTAVLINIVQCIVYMLIAIYVDFVYPGKYTLAQPTNFLYTELKARINARKTAVQSNAAEREQPTTTTPNPFIEPTPPRVEVGTQIQNLNKDFGGSPAIRNLSMDIHKGEIAVILGSKDSGKSTLLDVMCGTIPATSGKIFFEGEDILKDSYGFRESLGYCPHDNYLFPSLSTWEHLIFFALLKGYKLVAAKEESLVLMRALGLYQRRHNMIYSLSSGLRRKLALGIALIGNPKILILDEPTANIDPDTKKNVWNLLLQMRGKRTVILTTDSLEEAETLGDRIAFMDHGNLVCYGTSLFLKRALGIGYQITVKRKTGADGNRILALIQQHSPLSRVRGYKNDEIHYNVPFDSATSYPALFRELEDQSEQLGILRLGVSSRNMNELFSKIGSLTELLGSQMDTVAIRQEVSITTHTVLNERREMLSRPTVAPTIIARPIAPPVITSAQVATVSVSSSPRPSSSPTEIENGKIKGAHLLLNQLMILALKSRRLTHRRLRLPFLFGLSPVLLGVVAMFVSNVVIYELFPKSIPPFVKATFTTYDHPVVLLNDKSSEISDAYSSKAMKFGALIDEISTQYFAHDALELGKMDVGTFRRDVLVGGLFNENNHSLYYNNFHHHSLPISINLYTNSLSDISITTINHPLYTKPQDTCPNETKNIDYLVLMWKCTFFVAFMIFMMYFMYYPAKERINGMKHVLMLNNLSPTMYWLAAFLCDFLIYLLVIVVTITAISIQDDKRIFTDRQQIGAMLFIFVLYGFCGITYSYVFSNMKRSYKGLCITYVLFNIVCVLIFTPLWYHKLNNFGAGGGFFNVLSNLFVYFFPPFSLLSIIDSFLRLAWCNKYCGFCDRSYTNQCRIERGASRSYIKFASTYNEYGFLDEIVILTINTIFWIVFLLLIEVGVIKKIRRFLFNLTYGTRTVGRFPLADADVISEKTRVSKAKENPVKTKITLLVDGLVRNFLGIIRKFSPVKLITFATAPGECFGILGVSGSGKTTIMKILVGELLPSLGDAQIESTSLQEKYNLYLSKIGYSSQNGSVIERLTAKEIFEMLCILQGMPRDEIEDFVNKWIEVIGLEKYKDLECITYSPGNMKKLSVGIAMMSEPKVLFLDEPGTGADPVSRLNLYQLIRDVKNSGRCVVLTSSSMDECEAVCDRITILSNGVMRCLGNAAYLRNRFAQGFTIIITLNQNVTSRAFKVSNLRRDMLDRFRNAAQLRDESRVLLNYYISNFELKWSEMFNIMDTLKAEHGEILLNYTISDTPLEEVFIDISGVRG